MTDKSLSPQLISFLTCKFLLRLRSVLHLQKLNFTLISPLKHLKHLIFIYFLKIHLSKGQVRLITHSSTGQNHLSGSSGHRLFRTLLPAKAIIFAGSIGFPTSQFTSTIAPFLTFAMPEIIWLVFAGSKVLSRGK